MTAKRLQEIEATWNPGAASGAVIHELVAALRAERARAEEWRQGYDGLQASIDRALQWAINYKPADSAPTSPPPAKAEPEAG